MFEIKIAPQAAADLLEIKNYIENELQNPIAAHNTISKIIETYENLTAFPNVGIPVEKYVSFPTDYKFVLANKYSIFYRIENGVIKRIQNLKISISALGNPNSLGSNYENRTCCVICK